MDTIYVSDLHYSVFDLRNASESLVSGYASSLTASLRDEAFASYSNPSVTEIGTTGAYKYNFTPDAKGTWTCIIDDDANTYPPIFQSFKVIKSIESQLDTNESDIADNYSALVNISNDLNENRLTGFSASANGDKTTFTTTLAGGGLEDDYFKDELLTFTNGGNEYVSRWIKEYTDSTGEFIVYESLPYSVSSGDEFVIYAYYNGTNVSMLGTNNGILNNCSTVQTTHTSMLNTNEGLLNNCSTVQTTHTSMLNTNESMIDTNKSMINTNYDAIAGSGSDSSMIGTLKTWHWDDVDSFNSILGYTDNLESMSDTLEAWNWSYTYDMLGTQEDYSDTIISMVDTQETYSHDIISKCNTLESFNLWQMVGMGTGTYYYNHDGYYRNTEATGTQVLWATGETGALKDEDTGQYLDDVLITAYIVVGSFATGTRLTGNRGIADQTYTDSKGEYNGYLDPGIYDFHAYKDGYVNEYIRRELTTS